MTKWVYRFGDGQAEGGARDHEMLGGKGANLAEMCALGLPVPPGLTIVSDACNTYYSNGGHIDDRLKAEVRDGIAAIEAITGRHFGSTSQPLLLSVRSGARVSMPGMMDTVLNLGLNDETVQALGHDAGDARFAWDSYRRFIQMYADVVMGLGNDAFEEILEDEKAKLGHELDTELSATEWQHVVSLYKRLIEEELGQQFPQNPEVQLWGAVGAVFSSWKSARAVTYRQLHNIPEGWGTAVNIQAMVFGNLGNSSATGVAFTRNPSTGEKALYGEFLVNAQGEDVVAGIRTPHSITEDGRLSSGSDKPSMEKLMPEAFRELTRICTELEMHYRDMQDIEFTIERGKLWMLQTRSGKRSTRAAMKIAVDMVDEKVITEEEAVLRIEPSSLDQLLHPTIDPRVNRQVIGTGLPASPGAATGAIVFTAEEAVEAEAEGRKVILLRVETSPEDIHGMHAAEGILTTRGGMTSHAAVVARGMGIPCVVGAGTMRIDQRNERLLGIGVTLKKGDIITIDGSAGQVLKGEVPMIQPELSGDFGRIMGWADRARRMTVRTNADTPADARAARSFGAEGIGLCRTEHMFFEGERIHVMREMILAEDEKGRRLALDKLLPMQRLDFTGLFTVMHGLPVTIRLLDPPLHEFLPKTDDEVAEVAFAMGLEPLALRQRVDALHEFNPMLGHRGCRLAISYPEIVEMQARAIFEAAVAAAHETGAAVVPEIMVPLVGLRSELDYVKACIDAIAGNVMAEAGMKIDYLVGTMIELPRAALRAHVIAEAAEFFSFGTNDLTQTTFGISRDDASAFIPTYQRKGIIEHDPFISLDFDGVGELISIAAERGRRTRNDMKLGICGEHGGDPASIRFCETIGLDYVSCSPFRVPIARLAAAQAVISENM
ncbi:MULTISPECIES: pyruvate, phosphate dikinase [unclassified Rhizobium]|uniref:pyruvate, phosphate dikinase n=1 Tax=unclassified Rhizobium TaxID=2613769 RepID=UPI001C82A80B|nr:MULTISPECIES: pyruvate, phosphate dikinase [unclassified Rhizobium]MBX5214373.1 pyruvate, phosphate dikinase [Rhizobium sp. NLR9a]MBX5236694.1 pyruvate, phosphate dikinase [Rhizobium sp. NLR22b]MBX5246060.1 pyruvate, phosphate dikinase [Rhizobium sp. NLR3b]MBX5273702.1 pyruvate, phosphate dikinase [Rhizobium sp. NLR13a]MBX5279748.1 pyruvate, phosphate dikinase [Rhizobium sp. NLR10a]